MYVKFSKQKSHVSSLVSYLTKEEVIDSKQYNALSKSNQEDVKKCADYLCKEDRLYGETELFFNGADQKINASEVTAKISGNVKGLKSNESQFYMLTIAPAKDELEHLKEVVNVQAQRLGTQSNAVKEKLLRAALKDYTKEVMTVYAQNFGREGVNSEKDLVWFGKVEKDRYWKHDSAEVINNNTINKQIKELQTTSPTKNRKKIEILKTNLVKDGERVIYTNMPKSGLNHHIHVVVSRRDQTQTKSLSPKAQQRSSPNHQVNGHMCKSGFDRVQFALNTEKQFDTQFKFDQRPYHLTMAGRLEVRSLTAAKEKINTITGKLNSHNEKPLTAAQRTKLSKELLQQKEAYEKVKLTYIQNQHTYNRTHDITRPKGIRMQNSYELRLMRSAGAMSKQTAIKMANQMCPGTHFSLLARIVTSKTYDSNIKASVKLARKAQYAGKTVGKAIAHNFMSQIMPGTPYTIPLRMATGLIKKMTKSNEIER